MLDVILWQKERKDAPILDFDGESEVPFPLAGKDREILLLFSMDRFTTCLNKTVIWEVHDATWVLVHLLLWIEDTVAAKYYLKENRFM